MGGFEHTDLPLVGTGERATFVAEQLRLHQAGRNRTTVNRNERPAGAPRQRMQRMCSQFLARTGFAGDQHRQFHRRELVQHRAHRMQRGAFANQRVRSVPTAGCVDRRIIRIELLAHCADQVLKAERQREARATSLQQRQPGRRCGSGARWQYRQPGQMLVLLDPRFQQLQRRRIEMAQIEYGEQSIAPTQAYRHGGIGMDAAHMPACCRQRTALVRQRLAKPEHAT